MAKTHKPTMMWHPHVIHIWQNLVNVINIIKDAVDCFKQFSDLLVNIVLITKIFYIFEYI
jgi:hypothetical protein